jgi:hypothetical protein
MVGLRSQLLLCRCDDYANPGPNPMEKGATNIHPSTARAEGGISLWQKDIRHKTGRPIGRTKLLKKNAAWQPQQLGTKGTFHG